MSDKTRKRIWLMPVAAAIGVVAMLAVLAATVWLPSTAQAQSPFLPPDNLVATEISATQIDLSWTAGVGQTHYDVQRMTGSGAFVTVSTATNPGIATTYMDTGLTVSTMYTYRVRGVNVDRPSAWSTAAMATTMAAGTGTMLDPTDKAVGSSSTSGSATVELKLKVKLTQAVPVGGAFVLYLEDDFQEPDSILASDVYFVSTPSHVTTGSGSRVYATQAPEIDTDSHFTADKKDIDIRVSVPDMCTTDTPTCQGANGLRAGDTVTMVIQKSAGIKNPSEAGSHSTGYAILDSTADVPSGPSGSGFMKANELKTVAKISLSDVDNKRGYELTVTGSGFNDGTTATAWVLGRKPTTAEWWDELNCAEMNALVDPNKAVTDAEMGTSPCTMYGGLSAAHKALVDAADTTTGYAEMGVCRVVIDKGTAVGDGLVGSDDTVVVTFEVTVPTFSAGKNNYICMNDGEDRQSDTDVEDFHLEPSIRVVPSTVSSGDTVNVFAQDYPFSGRSLTQLKLAGNDVYNSAEGLNAVANLRNQPLVNGSAAISFEVPGSVDGAPLQGTVRVDARWGSLDGTPAKCDVDGTDDPTPCTSEDSKITVTGSELTASVTDVLPNETITITGNGFGTQTCIAVGNIQLDGVALQVDEESTISNCDHDNDDATNTVDGVEVSNSGQFVATITMWPEDREVDNPTLISGTHTLDVEDSDGFIGSTTLMIAEPTISVVPDVVGPRDYVVITGTNWPIDNSDNSNSGLVSVVIADDRNERVYSVYPDNIGRFTIEHRVSKDVAIPSTNQVKGSHSDVVKIGSFTVPAATVTVTPNQAQPGDTISLSATDMKPYAEADYVKVGGTTYNDPGANTDIDGNITIDDVLVPGLDPGTYSVIINVDGTVAIGELEVLAEDSAAGAGAELPGALEALGDSLVRVFHFNGVDKSWDFYDPRPDFAELNTLATLINGEPYWVLVSEGQEDVVLNNKARTLTCVGGDCWNQLVW